MKVLVVTKARHDGTLRYYIVPAERANEVVMPTDLDNDELVMEEFLSIVDYTEWIRENEDIEVTSYWEAKAEI